MQKRVIDDSLADTGDNMQQSAGMLNHRCLHEHVCRGLGFTKVTKAEETILCLGKMHDYRPVVDDREIPGLQINGTM